MIRLRTGLAARPQPEHWRALVLTGCDLGSPPTTYAAPGVLVGDPLSGFQESNGHIRFGDGTGGLTGDHVMPPDLARVADVDADGKLDLVKNVSGGVQVFLNRWDGRPG